MPGAKLADRHFSGLNEKVGRWGDPGIAAVLFPKIILLWWLVLGATVMSGQHSWTDVVPFEKRIGDRHEEIGLLVKVNPGSLLLDMNLAGDPVGELGDEIGK